MIENPFLDQIEAIDKEINIRLARDSYLEYVKYTYSGSESYEYDNSSIYINWGENFEFQIPQIND